MTNAYLEREIIRDQIAPALISCASAKRFRMKNVEHLRWQMKCPVIALTLPHYHCGSDPNVQTYSVTDSRWPLGKLQSTVLADGPGHPSAQSMVLMPSPTGVFYDHWVKAKPSMASRANLAVFLGEIRDIKRMFDILPGKYFHLKDWRELIRYGNSQHLNWNFGWAPFFREVKNVMKGLAEFEKRLNRFLREAGESLIKHVADDGTSGAYTGSWIVLSPYYGKRRWKFNWTNTFKSTFQFSYSLPPMDYQTLRWRAYLDTLGLHASIANLWALVPWSFVVDWFVNVGRLLDQFTDDWISPWITFCQGCISQKFVVDGGLEWEYQHPSLQYPPFMERIVEFSLSYYKRSVGVPSYAWSDTDALNADKIRLLASLAISRIL